MRIPLDDIADVAKSVRYDEDLGDLNGRLAQGEGAPRVAGKLAVDLTYYRAGDDLIFEGKARASALAPCARCLRDYPLPLAVDFRVVLASDGAKADGLECEFIGADQVDVAPMIHEHVLLSLPTRLICREDCRGLCPSCGSNRNTNPCDCPQESVRPRLAILHDLVRGRAVRA